MPKVVIALTYYAPYVSGLTNVARDLAEGLSSRGYDVVVVTNQHDATLPRTEWINGVRVVRAPVSVRIGKGVLSASFVRTVLREAKDADALNIHAPMLEAGMVARRVHRLTGAKVILTYHCDISLPAGLLNLVQMRAMDRSTRTAAAHASAIVVSSDDYANHSRISTALAARRHVIAPGCLDRRGGQPSYRRGAGLHVGFLGRIVEEKGIEYLVEGFAAFNDPEARLLIAGDFSKVAGGSVIDRVRSAIGRDARVELLGFLDEDQIPDFYSSLDVFALTSVNPFEAFGIVQVEAMIAGVPAMSSDLPGVRQPVETTGFGVVVRPRDSAAVTEGLRTLSTAVFDRPTLAEEALRLYGVDTAISQYEDLIRSLMWAGPRD